MLKCEAFNYFRLQSAHHRSTHFEPDIQIHLNQLQSTLYEIIIICDHSTFNQLTNIQTVLANATNLSFYTDGSVINLETPDCQMGLGWTQTDPNYPSVEF